MQEFQHQESGAVLSIDTSDNPTEEEIGKRLDQALMEFNLNEEKEKSSLAHKVYEASKTVAKDMGQGIMEAPFAVGSGILKGMDNASHFIDDITGGNYHKLTDKIPYLGNKGFYFENGNIYYSSDINLGEQALEEGDTEALNQNLTKVVDAPDSVTGNLVEGLSQFATGLALVRGGRIAVAGKSPNKYIERAFLLGEGALAPNVSFDPYEFRLANFFEDYMAENHPDFTSPAWVEWLAVDEDDSVAEARIKMFMEDLGIETATVGLLAPMAVAYKAYKKGKFNQEYKDSIDKAIDEKFNTENISITNLDKKREAIDADLRYKDRIALINRLNISAEEKKRLKAKAQKERLLKTDDEYLGTAGKTITTESLMNKADELYATVFHDTMDVREALDRAKVMGRDLVSESEYLAFLGRTHQNAHRDLLKSLRNLEMEERVHADALKRIDNRTDLDPVSKILARQKIDKDYAVATAKAYKADENYINSMVAFYDGRKQAGVSLNLMKQFQSFADGTSVHKAQKTFHEMMRDMNQKERATFSLGFIKHVQRGAVWTMRAMDELFINSILSGFKTQVVNMSMNSAKLILDPIERLLASGIQSTLLLDPKGGREHFFKTIGTVIGNAYATTQSAKLAFRSYQKGYTILDSNTTVESANRAVIGNDLSFDMDTLRRLSVFWRKKGDTATFADYLGLIGTPLRALSTRTLSAEDEFFKNMSFRGKVFGDSFANYLNKNLNEGMGIRLAMAKATEQANGMVERAITYQIHKNNSKRDGTTFISNDPEAATLAKEALQKSREMTFTQDLDQGWQHLQKTVATIPLARQVAPFVRTPMNLISDSLQRSPIAPLSGRWWDDFTSGNPERKAQALARWSIGASILSYVMLAPEDFPFSIASLRGASPDKWQQAKNEQELAGAIQGSVTVDGKEYQISRLDPIFTPFEGIATIAELHKSGRSEEADELFSLYALSLGKMLMNDTYGTGVRQLVNALNEPTGNAFQKLIVSRAAQLSRPWATLQKSINSSEDEFMREVRNLKDAYAVNTIGKSTNAPPRYNALFERIPSTPYAVSGIFGDSEWGTRIEELFSPIMVGEKKNDLIAEEVHYENIDVMKPMPYLMNGKIDLHSDAINLKANGERFYEGADFKRYTAYDRWNDLASGRLPDSIKLPNPFNPKQKLILREYLNVVINSKAYRENLTDNISIETKFGRKKQTIFKGSRNEILTGIINDFKEKAKEKLIAENPMLRKAIAQVELNKALSKTQKTQSNMILNQPLLGAGN